MPEHTFSLSSSNNFSSKYGRAGLVSLIWYLPTDMPCACAVHKRVFPNTVIKHFPHQRWNDSQNYTGILTIFRYWEKCYQYIVPLLILNEYAMMFLVFFILFFVFFYGLCILLKSLKSLNKMFQKLANWLLRLIFSVYALMYWCALTFRHILSEKLCLNILKQLCLQTDGFAHFFQAFHAMSTT